MYFVTETKAASMREQCVPNNSPRQFGDMVDLGMQLLITLRCF